MEGTGGGGRAEVSLSLEVFPFLSTFVSPFYVSF